MRILFIVNDLDNNPTAIVAKQFISGFQNLGFQLLVLSSTSANNDKDCNLYNLIIPVPYKILTVKDKISFILTFKDILSNLINTKTLNKYYKTILEFDPQIILTFASSDSFSIIELGNIISLKFSIPHHIHALDALPAPKCWNENYILRNAKINKIKKLLSRIQILTSTNYQMLEYQKKIINIKKSLFTAVMHNPISSSFVFCNKHIGKKKIIYIGDLNPNLKGRNGIEYYKSIIRLKDDTRFEFLFIGTSINVAKFFNTLFPLPGNIKFISWVENTDDYIKDASLLIDIDIDAKNDVFLSSKLIKYLNSDVPVLSITGENSPASNIFAIDGLGVVFVRHDSDQILNTIINYEAIKLDLNIRKEFIERFKIKNLIKNLLNLYQFHK